MWGFESLRAHQPPHQAASYLHRVRKNVSIKTVETESEGLKRAFMLTIPPYRSRAIGSEELAPQIECPLRPGRCLPPRRRCRRSPPRDALTAR